MIIGQRVLIVGRATTFGGEYGRVVSLEPILVLVDGESVPMHFSSKELYPVSEPQHMTAGD